MTSPTTPTKIDDLVMKAIKEKLAERAHQDLHTKTSETSFSEPVASTVDVFAASKVDRKSTRLNSSH